MPVESIALDWNAGHSIYASEAYLRGEGDGYGWLASRGGHGGLRCVLPYMLIRKGPLRLVRFPTETMLLEPEIGVDEERHFLGEVVEYFRASGAHAIVPATFNAVFRTYPPGAVAAPFGSFILDLVASEDELLQRMHSKHRNGVRGAQKKGVKVHVGDAHWETAYALVRASFMRSATGVVGRARVAGRLRHGAFRRQLERFGEHVRVFVAVHEGVAQGCAVVPFSGYRAYYMHGGSIANPVTGAMNLLHWEAIRRMRAMGVRSYDFFGGRVNPEPGSKIEGIMKFKERFGGQFTEGYAWKFPLDARMYRLYALAARLRNGGDLVDQERHKLAAPASPP